MQLPAVATLTQAHELLVQLDAAFAAGGAGGLEVDASALTEFDTSTLALLLHGRRVAAAQGVAFTVAGAPPKLRELAKLYGVESLLSLDAEAT